jgi:hypothetical protein
LRVRNAPGDGVCKSNDNGRESWERSAHTIDAWGV